MKIYRTAEGLVLHHHPQNKSDLHVIGGKAGSFRFVDSKLRYEEYKVNQELGRFYAIDGDIYRQVENNKVLLVNDDGEEPALPDIFKRALSECLPKIKEDGTFAVYLSNHPKKFKSSLAVFDCIKQSFVSAPISAIFHSFIDEHIYGYDRKMSEIFKVSTQLEYIWAYKLDFKPVSGRTKKPLKYHDVVVTFTGPKESHRDNVNGTQVKTFSGGYLLGLSDADGSVVWQQDMPNAIDGIFIYNDILYVTVMADIFIINPLTGEELHCIHTQCLEPADRSKANSSYVDNHSIYFTSYEDGILLIYDAVSYELIKTVKLPQNYHIDSYQFTDETTGKLYFSLTNNTQFVAKWPVLEVDPNNLDTEVEFEPEPDKTIELVPVSDEKEEHELVITMTTPSLDDALRFGEIYTRDLAQWHSHNYMGMTFNDRQPTATFNGVIRFVYSGCEKDAATVNEHLRVMEKRFELWNEKEGFYSCVDKNQLTRLVAQYRQ
jgi:outer membrane protein assembly factor BamB